MNLLHARAVYRRANSEDPISYDRPVELSTLHFGNEILNSGVSPVSGIVSTQNSSADTQECEDVAQRNISRRLFASWRAGAFWAAMIGIVSLVINSAAIIWTKGHYDRSSGLFAVYTGNCGKVRTMSLWVHFAINVLSTLLLGGSNYCMQCLASPTRKEIDKAHARGQYLDIGVPNIRNLRMIATHKVVLWWILALSSVPLHLLYNSAFYDSLSTNDYNIFVAAYPGVTAKNYTTISHPTAGLYPVANVTAAPSGSGGNYHRLETLDCVKVYENPLLSDQGNVVLVSSNFTGDPPYNSTPEFVANPIIHLSDHKFSYNDPKLLTEFPYKIDYCLSELVSEKCTFNGNIPIIATVILCNFVKVAVMSVVAFSLKDSPLVTIGDAVESFLTKPDVSTKGLCWMTRNNIVETPFLSRCKPDRSYAPQDSYTRLQPSTITLEDTRWAHAASYSRWIWTSGLGFLALVVTIVLFTKSVSKVHDFNNSIWKLGLGQIHTSAIITSWSIEQVADPDRRILFAILIANLPQTIFSFIYLNLNGLLTCIWSGAEWNRFARERKYLRVSTPKGRQKSTYFLQLPYSVGLPLLVVSSLLHWLVSQALFLVVVAEYDDGGTLVNPITVASCGFSPMAMFVAIIIGFFMIIATCVNGRVRRQGGIPIVGSCSAAISAACHPPEWDHNAALRAVQYGQIPGSGDADGIWHCSFSSGAVEKVREDVLYAGM